MWLQSHPGLREENAARGMVMSCHVPVRGLSSSRRPAPFFQSGCENATRNPVGFIPSGTRYDTCSTSNARPSTGLGNVRRSSVYPPTLGSTILNARLARPKRRSARSRRSLTAHRGCFSSWLWFTRLQWSVVSVHDSAACPTDTPSHSAAAAKRTYCFISVPRYLVAVTTTHEDSPC